MLAYARSDTHYLLYIYDKIRRDLITVSTSTNNPDLLPNVLDSCRRQAVIAYQREPYDFEEGSGAEGWRKLLQSNKGPTLHSSLQFTVFKRLHRWRDQLARQEDESVHYVLPNRSLLNIAATLPHSMQSVVAICNPVPPLVQVYAQDIAYIVATARKALSEETARAETLAAESIKENVQASVKNRVTGSTHLWYKDEASAPNGVRSTMEAVQHGTQFDIWTSKPDRLQSLILTTSQFWEPLKREYVIGQPLYEVGGSLEDIKLSVPLPPLTAKIYMDEEDAVVVEKEDDESEHVVALEEHPFVKRFVEENVESSAVPEVFVIRNLQKKEKQKRVRQETSEAEGDGDESDTNDEVLGISSDVKPIREKKKSKRRKKERLETKVKGERSHGPVEQFDPYKQEDIPESVPKPHKPKGGGAGRSMTFKA
jgi:exosome complex exonuclease RRP6